MAEGAAEGAEVVVIVVVVFDCGYIFTGEEGEIPGRVLSDEELGDEALDHADRTLFRPVVIDRCGVQGAEILASDNLFDIAQCFQQLGGKECRWGKSLVPGCVAVDQD